MEIAIIGGGAAGFFAAISAKTHHPEAKVVIYEKSNKLLAKVKVSGGGRCNVTHACFNISQLSKFYPRGEKQLKKSFGFFNTNNTVEWFESRNVKLKTEPDNRMFPVTDNSQTIIDCLIGETMKLNINILLSTGIEKIEKLNNGFQLLLNNSNTIVANKVIIATGGSPKIGGFQWIKELGHNIISPVPSLFTFNIPGNKITKLMGVVAKGVCVRIQGTKLKHEGDLLVTHWGMSGPAILKLSAWGARTLNDMNYDFKAQVSWLGDQKEQETRELLQKEVSLHPKKKMINKNPFQLSSRLWTFLLEKIDLNKELIWSELGKKNLNRLLNILMNDVYEVKGKTTFKEEFVTCGGVSLQDVNMRSMESNICSGLYFAGEVLDIDGITGGFNFQAAWTTGFIAGKNSVL